ncbi:MAG: glutamate-5-semialdehyde dehydrogenase [Capsulimonadales bacterium]|nr:glutamate-5-semialdehyde dehydrogenase [Capsulimonadales bacterium]
MENDALIEVETKAAAARNASSVLAGIGTAVKNAALVAIADSLGDARHEILEANGRDLSLAADKGVPPHMRDRLALNDKRIAAMQAALRQLVSLPDPVGVVLGGWRRPNGLRISKVRVPLGVLGIIYESRPNVTVDAASLCLKAGNAVVLRGGSEAIYSNIALSRTIAAAAESAGIPSGAIALIENTDRAAVRHLMTLSRYIDCLIPRGGASLIETVVKNATVPVIETGTGNCHVYVHEDADREMATAIAVNAKCQRPSVCNSMETLLVHRSLADDYLPYLLGTLHEKGVELRGCPVTVERGYRADVPVTPATDEDYFTEFNDLVLAVRVVADLSEAIAHIRHYGTRHSEAIVTRDYEAGQRFVDAVDAAAVYINASTRFTDGEEFGFGAEIGISNQKLHARGPMGLEELTTYKYVVQGNGQLR